jgi:hypothetical protein
MNENAKKINFGPVRAKSRSDRVSRNVGFPPSIFLVKFPCQELGLGG